METLLGYEVEKLEEPTGGQLSQVAYYLRGPRGAFYALVRHYRQPELLYVMNLRSRFPKITSAQGYSWFTDRSGKLEAVRCPTWCRSISA